MTWWRRGWSMARGSYAVLKQHPRLAILPVISGFAFLIVAVLILGALVPTLWNWINEDTTGYVLVGAIAFVVIYGLTATAIFFNVALVHCAMRCHAGAEPSIRQGLAAAAGLLPQILGWALVAATVGILLNALQSLLKEKLGFIGDLIGALFAVSWAAMTYFVVPVLVTERLGPIAALRRSGEILKAKWGELLAGEARFGLIGILFFLLAALIFFGGLALALEYNWTGLGALGVILMGLGVVAGIATMVVLQTLSTIFQSGVYLYATTGQVPTTLDPELVANTFHSKTQA